MTIFIIYSNLGNELSPVQAYSVVTLIEVLNWPLWDIVFSWNMIGNSVTGLKRIEHFLASSDRSQTAIENEQSLPCGTITIENAFFQIESIESRKHEEDGKELFKASKMGKFIPEEEKKSLFIKTEQKGKNEIPEIIENINFSALPGEFIAVVGEIGSGKSSFLNAILGELIKSKGRVKINGKISYIGQVPWLMNATVKENILFFNEFEKEKYEKILSISELNEDLKLLPGGDLTEIGERGINLSGGQKQRICIARAIYQEADIFLIDDCLSSLDAHVGKQIFNNVFKNYLKGKTIILVTHALQYLPDVDRVVVFQKGKIVENGSFQSLCAKETSFLKEFIDRVNEAERAKGKDNEKALQHSTNKQSHGNFF